MTEFSFVAQSPTTSPNQYARGIVFNSSGTTCYTTGAYADDVYQYSLSTPWDISTAVYSKTKAIATEKDIRCIKFNTNGTRFYLTGDQYYNQILQYSVATPWDIETIVYSKALSSPLCNFCFNFNSDGTKIYLTDISNLKILHCYSLSTAWDLGSVSFVNTSSAFPEVIRDFNFLNNGKALVLNTTTNIYEYILNTAWNITSANLLSTISFASLGRSNEEYSSFVTNDKLFLHAGAYARIYEYSAIYSSSRNTLFEFPESEEEYTPPAYNDIVFNFLPDEDYHILTLSASFPMPTLEMTGTSSLPPYNAINLNFPMITCEMEGDSWRGAIGDTYGDIIFDLPMLECVMYSGGAVIDIILPILIVEMSTPIEPIFAQIDCLIPMIELEMLQIDPISAYMSAVIPMLTASIEGDCKFTGMNISLPVPTMRAYSGVEMTISLPVPNFSMTASAAKAGYLTASLPVPQFVAYSGALMEITLPVPMVEMVADTPIIATMNVNLKILSLVMSATSLAPTTLNAILPVPQFIATSRGCLFNSMNCTLPLIDIEMSGINGGVAALESEIPMLHMIMQGFFHREGGNYINITLPILAMYSEAYGATTSEILRHVRGQER